MRLNVYAEEITDRVELVRKTADTGASFIGVRFFLESSEKLFPPQHPDDDSSAVTFWVRSARAGYRMGDERELVGVLSHAIELLCALQEGDEHESF